MFDFVAYRDDMVHFQRSHVQAFGKGQLVLGKTAGKRRPTSLPKPPLNSLHLAWSGAFIVGAQDAGPPFIQSVSKVSLERSG